MENWGELGNEFWTWVWGQKGYFQKKLKIFAFHFETAKGFVVDFLMAKRGLRQRPFLHFGMMILLGASAISAPIIATNYPLFSKKENLESPSAVLNLQTAAEVETVTEESVKPRDKIIIYKVEKGDTLSSIGQKFGISVDTIRWANGLKNVKDISIGQELKILPVTGVTHAVLKGDTIYTIAKKYSANPQAIVDFPFNDFLDPSSFTLALGTVIVVPEGMKPAEKPWSPPKPSLGPIFAGGTGQFAWPASGELSQRFSWYHPGIDIANKLAPQVLAADDGVVISAKKEKWGYGWHLILDNGGGLQTLYAHLQDFNVGVGDKVSRGQAIGQMGSTGRSTGTHAHFEIWKDGKPQNPLNYLK